MNEEELKIAIIGAGNMAREHIPAFSDLSSAQIAGIYSRTPARAVEVATEFRIPQVYDSIHDLYNDTQADLVIVTVTEPSMKSVVQDCFEHPWAVFMEKPPGLNSKEAQELLSLAKSRKRLAMVGLNRRFLGSTQAALTDLSTIEAPRFIMVHDQQDLRAAQEYGHSEEVIRHWMFANSIHTIDYLSLFGRGGISNVEQICAWDPEKPWLVIAKIEFESGDVGLYKGIWDGPGPWAVSVTTSAKRWELRPLENASYQFANSREIHSLAASEIDQKFKPGFRLQAEQVIEAVRGNDTEVPDLEESLKTMTLIEDIFTP